MPSNARKARKSGSHTIARAANTSIASANSLVGVPLKKIAQELRHWTDTVLGIAGSATDLSLNLAKAKVREPRNRAAIERAGSILRQAREAAGMTTKELGRAINASDPELLEQAEIGKVALPFEMILRLAGVLGRHDPLTFVMKLARSYNPPLWKALEDLGIGRLAVQAGRERELANLYRANDAARKLSDADFAAVLAFARSAFDMAVDFRSEPAVRRATHRAKSK